MLPIRELGLRRGASPVNLDGSPRESGRGAARAWAPRPTGGPADGGKVPLGCAGVLPTLKEKAHERM